MISLFRRSIFSSATFFKKASAQYYPDFIEEKIFKPLAMSQTGILNPTGIVKGRTVSYYRNAVGKLLNNNFCQISVGPHFDVIGTTIENFIKYEQAIANGLLLKKNTYQMVWSPARVSEGRKVSQFEDEADLFNANASYGLNKNNVDSD